MSRLARPVGVVAVVVGSLASAAPAWGHPIGGRADLPVPVGLFAVIAGLALVGAFVGLTLTWTRPSLQHRGSSVITGHGWVHPVIACLRLLGLAALTLVVVAGLADGTETSSNIAPVVVFILFWLGVPFVAAFVGDWWRWLSPWRTLTRAANHGVAERPELVTRYGVWPAALALLAFGWFTLVSPASGRPQSLAIAALLYTAYVVITGRIVGPETGLRLFDAFHTSNGVIGAVAPIDVAVAADGPGATTVTRRRGVVHPGWLRRLPALPEWPGFPAFVVTMIGIVAYDGLTGTELWIAGLGDLRHEQWVATLALIGAVAVIGSLYAAAAGWGARLAGRGRTPALVARRFAHILVPVAAAYALAHYVSLVLYEGQLLFSMASDPFGRGWDLFGTADWKVVYFLSSELIWYLQVAAMVAGQTAALILSHDRALADLGPDGAARIQYAMLTLVVALTSLGLFLLSG